MRFTFRLILLAAVMIQFTPLRVCAIETITLGSSCHEWASDLHCGSATPDSHDACVCEQPKPSGYHGQREARPPVDLAESLLTPIIATPLAEYPAFAVRIAARPPDVPCEFHLPLLI